MAAPHGSESPTPAIPNTSQTSTRTWAKSSEARSYASPGQKLKDEQSVQDQSQQENTLAHNSVSFKYSAASPAADVSTSADNQQVPAVQKMYRGNTVSILHYLERKIKQITSKIDSYYLDLDSDVKLINSKISSYAGHIDRRIRLIQANNDSHTALLREILQLKNERDSHVRSVDMELSRLKMAHAYVLREIECLDAHKDSHFYLLARQMVKLRVCEDSDNEIEIQDLINHDFARYKQNCVIVLNNKNAYALHLDMLIKLLSTDNSHPEDLDRKIQLLSARMYPSAQKVIRQVRLLNTKKEVFECNLDVKVEVLNEKKAFYFEDIQIDYRLLKSNIAPFARDLHTHLKLLESKIASFNDDFRKQKDQLRSNLDAYWSDLNKKMNVSIIIEQL